MKVEATQLGYHDHRRRRPGDIFVLRPIKKANGEIITPEQQFSKNWMKKVIDPSVKEVNTPKIPIAPGNLDAVREREQPQHKSIEQHQAEAAAAKQEEKAPEEESVTTGGPASSGDEDLI